MFKGIFTALLTPFDKENKELYETKKEENKDKTKHFNHVMKNPIRRRRMKRHSSKKADDNLKT